MSFLTKAISHIRSAVGLDSWFGVRSLTGALALTLYDGPFQIVDPGGAARNATLPAVTNLDDGRVLVVYNTADSDGEPLSVLQEGGATLLATVQRGELGFFRVASGTWAKVGPTLGGVPTGVVSERYALSWIAGARGKPGINADIQNATESVRMIADPMFEVLGTNGVSASTAINAEGGVTLTTAGASGDQVIVAPHLDTSQTAWSAVTWGTDKATAWECRIRTAAAITDCVIWAGLKLTNTSVTATDNDQAFFRYAPATNSGKWQAVYSIGGTDVSADTGVTVAVSTAYHLRIEIDASRVPRFYCNGVLVATGTALTNATDLIPYIGVEASAAAAKSLVVQGQAISRIAG